MKVNIRQKSQTAFRLRYALGATGPQGEQGIQGIQGVQGYKGWSPILATVTDGIRRVLQVSDWTGGEGTKPASGSYIGPTGLVPDIASAVDIRGAQGPSGSVTDGDKGDIVVSSAGTVWNIDGAVLTTAGRAVTSAADAAAQRTALGAIALSGGTMTGTLVNNAQPAFFVRLAADAGAANGFYAITMTSVSLNRGSVYNTSTSRFTAPVSGAYLIEQQVVFKGGADNTGAIEVSLYVNGSAHRGVYYSKLLYYQTLSVVSVVNLAAGDFVVPTYTLTSAAGSISLMGFNTCFSGHLIG